VLLLVGDPEDLTMAYMAWLASDRELAALSLPEQTYGVDWWARFEERGSSFELFHQGKPIDLATLFGGFVRLNPIPALPDGWTLSDHAHDLFVQERRAALAYLLDRIPTTIVNRPSAGRSNGSKPLHMTELAAAAFDVPDWIVGNDPTSITAFMDTCPAGAVVKATSGLRSHVRLAGDEFRERLSTGTSPAVVQRLVPGYEVRVHVVGDMVFGSRVDADAVDYRFDEQRVAYEPCAVPAELAAKCRSYASQQGLVLAGFDFRVDSSGRWWCLEMNPVPTFLPYEAATGHAIGHAILDCLLDLDQPSRHTSPIADHAPRIDPPKPQAPRR
jgi:hypothetical protein